MHTRLSFLSLTHLFLACLIGLSCGGGGSGGVITCDPVAQTGCGQGQVCEEVQGGDPNCFAPLTFQGSVVNLETGAAITGARLVALDANGSPVSNVCPTDAAGACSLTVSLTRDASGKPMETIYLRADAPGFLTFPGGGRPPFPISTSGAQVDANGNLILDPALTTVALTPLPDPSQCPGSISGTAQPPPQNTGTMVVAETTLASTPCGLDPATPGFTAGTLHGFTAIADRDSGEYHIFNLPAGSYAMAGYAKGQNYIPNPANPATVTGNQNTAVNLTISGAATGVISGKVDFANAPLGDQSSVILVLESTFLEVDTTLPNGKVLPILIRGETVPGMRDVVSNTDGNFMIDGIPDGQYVVLAAFENDILVRDPDVCIGGTEIFHITSGGQAQTIPNFKVTDALTNPIPDNNQIVTGDPLFTWDRDPSAEQYHLFVFDSFALKLWETTIIASGSANPTINYNTDGTGAGMATIDPLPAGFYQFRVFDTRDKGNGDQCPISQTEDFRGVFEVQ